MCVYNINKILVGTSLFTGTFALLHNNPYMKQIFPCPFSKNYQKHNLSST